VSLLGDTAQAGRVRVHADEEALAILACERERQTTVTRAEVDRDATLERREEFSESVIGALEALAADDVHDETSLRA
jgi:hypothetical protein